MPAGRAWHDRAAGASRPRRFGKSKYGISRTIRVLLDLITIRFLLSYGTRPMQIFGLLGLSISALAC
ncbi:MAG: hypothetical protein U0Z44_01625 [Kouleothrix sp.]